MTRPTKKLAGWLKPRNLSDIYSEWSSSPSVIPAKAWRPRHERRVPPGFETFEVYDKPQPPILPTEFYSNCRELATNFIITDMTEDIDDFKEAGAMLGLRHIRSLDFRSYRECRVHTGTGGSFTLNDFRVDVDHRRIRINGIRERTLATGTAWTELVDREIDIPPDSDMFGIWAEVLPDGTVVLCAQVVQHGFHRTDGVMFEHEIAYKKFEPIICVQDQWCQMEGISRLSTEHCDSIL